MLAQRRAWVSGGQRSGDKQWERDLEGEEGWERHAGRSMTVRSEASALFPVTSPAPRTAASTEGRLPKRRLNGRLDRRKEGIRI